MNTRRSFFSRIGAAIATIALAPELAFRAKLALPEVIGGWDVGIGEASHEMVYACNQNGVYEMLSSCGKLADGDGAAAAGVNLDELFRTAYDIKKKRKERGVSEHYLLVKIES